MNHEQHCDALELEVSRFAGVLENADPQLRVPSCPAWSVADLTEHLGLVHRWAHQLVTTLADERIPFPSANEESDPVGASWLRRGGDLLLEALRSADPDSAMWAWGRDQHVRFWSRRQAHETLVHRVDLELALGAESSIESVLASDAIDEFFVNLASAARFSPRVRQLRGSGEVVSIEPDEGNSAWKVQLDENGFSLVERSSAPDVRISGSSRDLLLAIFRRMPLELLDVRVSGERALLDFWIANSALE